METQDIQVDHTIVKSTKMARVDSNGVYLAKGIAFLLLLIITWFLLAYAYMSLHGINIVQRLTQPTIPLDFDYIGGKPNPFAIGMEILYWSLVGVTCETAYITAQSMLNKNFTFQKFLIKYISTSLFAVGIAHAVIFTLQIIKLTVAGVEITLENAPILTIMAISFLLGFYNEHARDLLDRLRSKLTSNINAS